MRCSRLGFQRFCPCKWWLVCKMDGQKVPNDLCVCDRMCLWISTCLRCFFSKINVSLYLCWCSIQCDCIVDIIIIIISSNNNSNNNNSNMILFPAVIWFVDLHAGPRVVCCFVFFSDLIIYLCCQVTYSCLGKETFRSKTWLSNTLLWRSLPLLYHYDQHHPSVRSDHRYHFLLITYQCSLISSSSSPTAPLIIFCTYCHMK